MLASYGLLRVVWEGVKRAEGGVASILCDTPTGRSDEGLRASCRVLCDYVRTRPHRVGDWVGWSASLDRLEKCPTKSGKSALRKLPSQLHDTDWKTFLI